MRGPVERPIAQSGTAPAPVEAWQSYLARELDRGVHVVYTRARRMPIRIRPIAARTSGRRTLEVRMHAMFADAPPGVWCAVASWIKSGRRAARACNELDRWIHAALAQLPPPKARARALRLQGEHHDLEALRADVLTTDLSADFPDRALWPLVTWGRRGPSRTRHSIRLGSFDADTRVARIHPVLDQEAVPRSFVRYVLFHELLHAALPPRPGRGARWVHHSSAFRKRERAYAGYAAAIAWEKAHMDRLIRSARRGTPMRVVAEEGRPRATTDALQPAPPGFWQGLLFSR